MADVLVMTNTAKLAALADVVAGDLAGAKINLVKADFIPSPTIVIGDLPACNYTGNGAETITWLAPSIGDDGEPEVVGTAGEFRPTDGVVPNSAFGFMLLETGGALRGCGLFSGGPKPMSSVLDSILLTTRVRLNPYGGLVVSVT